MTRCWAVAALVLFLFSPRASGQELEPRYCAVAGVTFSVAQMSKTPADLEKGWLQLKNDCRPGDIISLPATFTVVVARICDFSRSMVNTGKDVLCVVGKLKDISPK